MTHAEQETSTSNYYFIHEYCGVKACVRNNRQTIHLFLVLGFYTVLGGAMRYRPGQCVLDYQREKSRIEHVFFN